MRRGFVVSVVLLLVLATSVAMAGIESGLGVLVSWGGTEKQEWTSRMVLHEEGTGRNLVPENGIVMPAPDRAILGQIIFAKDMDFRPEAFKFSWATVATPREEDWHQAGYHAKYGYIFRIDPDQYGCAEGLDTPLQLQVWIKNGKKPFFRVIFKITLPKSAIGRDILWIRPTQFVQPGMTAPAISTTTDAAKVDDNFAKLSAAIDQLGRNQQAIADSINVNGTATADLVARVGRLEAWADAAVAQSKQPTQPTPAVATAPSTKFSWKLVLPPGKWGINIVCRGVTNPFPGPFCGTVEFRDATIDQGEVNIAVRIQLVPVSGGQFTVWRSAILTGPCTVVYSNLEEVR